MDSAVYGTIFGSLLLVILMWVLYIALILLVVAAVLLIYILIAKKMASVVVEKGYTVGEVHAFAMCFWLGPIGYIYVAALPDRTLQKQNEKIIELLSASREANSQERLVQDSFVEELSSQEGKI